MKKVFRKAIYITLSTILILGSVIANAPQAALIYAVEAPSAPAKPGSPEQPTTPSQPKNKPSQPEQPEQPTQPKQPENSSSPSPSPAPSQIDSTTPQNTSSSQPTTVKSGGTDTNGNLGDTQITTGNANAAGEISSNVNTNIGSQNTQGTGGSGTTAKNTGNGSNSENTTTVNQNASAAAVQTNSATITDQANLQSTSGSNSIKNNTAGNNTINTGDSNTALTVVNQANTNISGADIVEFNVVDDHVGDIVLDFSNPCVNQGCVAGSPTYLANSGNGSGSQNTIDNTSTQISENFQNNDATIENNIILSADSGNNSAKGNTGGDNTIITGDANVSANVVNFANNNISGNVIVGIVNIFGDLIGDLIIPEQNLQNNGGTYLANMDNGSNSLNFASVDESVLNQVTQQNTANIANNLNLDANTGGNLAKDNTGGNNTITTGETNVVAEVLNIANTNILGGTWWIVLVNEAGNWIGKIFGGQEGVNYAGSPGTEFIVNPDGSITAANTGNGSGSTNETQSSLERTTTTAQQNTANITNNLNLSSNTGGNKLKDNTNGNNAIQTGDANIVASVVNFLNNNFIGGKVYLTVVNVFGSWLGDILPPGMKKDADRLAKEEEHESVADGTGGFTAGSSDTSESDTTILEEDNSFGSDLLAHFPGYAIGETISGKTLGAKVTNLENNSSTLLASQIKNNPQVKKIIRFNLAPLIIFTAILITYQTGKRVLPLLLALARKKLAVHK